METKNKLQIILLEVSGSTVKFGADTEQELQNLVNTGRFRNTQGLTTYKKDMMPNQCHKNSALLKLRKKSYKIVTGYALSDDNIWFSHSWLTNGTNIIETTFPFKRYFGYELKDKELEEFINENLFTS